MFALLNPHGDICAFYSPFLNQLTMYVVHASYGLVCATVGVGTVLIWDFSIAVTRGGGTRYFSTNKFQWSKTHQIRMQRFSVKKSGEKNSMSDCNFYTPQLLCTPKAQVVGVA